MRDSERVSQSLNLCSVPGHTPAIFLKYTEHMQAKQLQPWYTDRLFWAVLFIWSGVLGALSLMRYWGYNSGILDMGAMSQAIFSVARGQPLMTTGATGNFSRLAGHVELIYLLFVPLTLIWRDPQALLIAQTLLAAAGAIPVYRLALRRLDSLFAARCAALIYLLYPVGLTAVLFDFHGDTLAMPLLLFAIDALDRRAWRSFAIWAGLALMCKLYIALPVAGIGAYLFLWGRERKVGLITGLVALAYGAFAFLVVRELFKPVAQVAPAAAAYTKHYFGDLGQIPATLDQRIISALVVFGPPLFLAWRGWRWLLVGAPLAMAALLTTGPGGGYDYRYHHYAAVVPFMIVATIEGAARLRARAGDVPADAGQLPASPLTPSLHIAVAARPRNWRADLLLTTFIVLIFAVLLVDMPLNPLFWRGLPNQGLDHSAYGIVPRDRIKDRFLAEYVPARAPMAASMFLGAHLADRDWLYSVRYNDDPGGERLPAILPRVDYVLADALFDWRAVIDGQSLAGVAYEQKEIGITLGDPSFGLTAERDGLLLFQRNPAPGAALNQEISVVEQASLTARPLSFGSISLVGATIEPLDGRRYRASFEWRLSGDEPLTGDMVAVSRLEGVEGARIVHLPSFTLLPTSQWQPGQVIREQFELELPADVPPGSYSWLTGWYNPAHPEAQATDERSRLPSSAEEKIATIEVH